MDHCHEPTVVPAGCSRPVGTRETSTRLQPAGKFVTADDAGSVCEDGPYVLGVVMPQIAQRVLPKIRWRMPPRGIEKQQMTALAQGGR
jgi:hypothetical protein